MLVFTLLTGCLGTIVPLAAPGSEPQPSVDPMLFPLPPYNYDIEPGVVIVSFKETYFGSFSSEEFPGLEVIEIKDLNQAQYELWSITRNVNDPQVKNMLDMLKTTFGIDFQIKLSQGSKVSVVEAIRILSRNPKVYYAMPSFKWGSPLAAPDPELLAALTEEEPPEELPEEEPMPELPDDEETTEPPNPLLELPDADPLPWDFGLSDEEILSLLERKEMFPAPPYNKDFEPGVVVVGFYEPYFGSFSNEEFPGLDVIEIKDINLSLYESLSALPFADELTQDVLNRLKNNAGLEYKIMLTQGTRESVVEAIAIFEKNLIVDYAIPNFILENAGIFDHDPDPTTDPATELPDDDPLPETPDTDPLPELPDEELPPEPRFDDCRTWPREWLDDYTLIPRDWMFTKPPYARDFEPGAVMVGFYDDGPYFGSFTNEEFPGLDVAEVKDYYMANYKSISENFDVNAPHIQKLLNELESLFGTLFEIKLSQGTKDSVGEAIMILEKNPLVFYAHPLFYVY
jgi:hypothetical protein